MTALSLRTDRPVCAHTKKAHPEKYYDTHEKLRQEVELMRQSDEIDRLFLAAFEIEMEDPDQFRRIAEAF